MKIVFVSNYLNHHVMPMCKVFIDKTDNNFYFIATTPINETRLKFGYEDLNSKYPWVIKSYESSEQMLKAKKILLDADVLIVGNAPYKLIKERLLKDKLTFRFSERIYKKKPNWYEMPARIIMNYFKHGRYKNCYMLSASAYTAKDYALTFTYVNKCFKWGYFPETIEYPDIENLIAGKEKNSIIWAGRFIDFKHPEYAINLAKRLKNDGYDFKIKMIGNGEKVSKIKEMISQQHLEENVIIMGAMSPENVRKEMEKSEIHIFTSDRNEGWGAVLNEAMNCGCACICNNAIGSVGFIIDDNINGLKYGDGDFEEFYSKVKTVLDNKTLGRELGIKAYKTIVEEWNANNAVNKFIALINVFFENGKIENIFKSGVCSRAD